MSADGLGGNDAHSRDYVLEILKRQPSFSTKKATAVSAALAVIMVGAAIVVPRLLQNKPTDLTKIKIKEAFTGACNKAILAKENGELTLSLPKGCDLNKGK